MMQSGHQHLLLPAKGGFIWGSLVVAALLNMLPLGPQAWLPDFLALTLVFWNVHQPRRVGVSTAFLFGLVMDVHQTALLGQHALSYCVLSFAAISLHRRILWFNTSSQAWHVFALFACVHLIEFAVRMLIDAGRPGYELILAPCLEALLWPVATGILLAPQRRPPDPDNTRPL